MSHPSAAAADRALFLASHLLDERQKPDRPAFERGMVNRYPALFHHFLDMLVAQRVSHTPLDANDDDIDRETHSFEAEHIA